MDKVRKSNLTLNTWNNRLLLKRFPPTVIQIQFNINRATHKANTMQNNPSWHPTAADIRKKLPSLHGTSILITVIIGDSSQSVPWSRQIQSITYLYKIHFNTILPPDHGIPMGLITSDFPSKFVHVFVICPMRAVCPAHLILFTFINLIILCEENKLRSFSLCNVPELLVASCFFGPNIYI